MRGEGPREFRAEIWYKYRCWVHLWYSCLVSDELTRRGDRLLERRRKQAGFRDSDKSLDNFDFAFNPKINRSLVFDLATAAFINKREDVLFLGPGGTGKSHLAQAIGQAAIHQGYKVMYRETHVLLDELADAIADGTRKEYMDSVATVTLLIIVATSSGRLFLNRVGRHQSPSPLHRHPQFNMHSSQASEKGTLLLCQRGDISTLP